MHRVLIQQPQIKRLEVDANKDLISVAKGTADNKDFLE